MATIAVLGTLDTKGIEHEFVAEQIRRRGHSPLLIDVGTSGNTVVNPDVTCWQVANAAGIDLGTLVANADRGEAVTAMATAASSFLVSLQATGQIDGVISLGGGGGTAIATAAMRALPLGFPKLMVSTLAAGNTAAYLGTKDIVMMPSIVDISGLNRISRVVFSRAVGAICGMVEAAVTVDEAKPLVVASMFGNTTDCVNQAKAVIEASGYEVLVFHATGVGGRAMESLIESGLVSGVLDITTTELADELAGGVLSAGSARLEAAGKMGVPAIVVPGCLDMVNFGEPQTIPARYADRLFYVHNPQVTLMRTNVQECQQLGEILAKKLNVYLGPISVLIPTKAISIISASGQPFYDPEADAALFEALTTHLDSRIALHRLDLAINDAEFAKACAQTLLGLIARVNRSAP